MIDWIQVLIAGLSGGIAGAVSLFMKTIISATAETQKQKNLLTALTVVCYVGFGVLLWNIFPESPRGLTAIRGFVIMGLLSLIIGKAKKATEEGTKEATAEAIEERTTEETAEETAEATEEKAEETVEVTEEGVEKKETEKARIVDSTGKPVSRKLLLGIVAVLLLGLVVLLYFASRPVVEEIPDYITIQGEQFSTELTELSFWRGGITGEDIKPLRHMTNLVYLNLGYNRIDALSPISNLTNLETLILTGTGITELTALSGLYNLTHLRAGNNVWISDITPLTNLTNLEILQLGNNRISDLEPLSNLTNLTNLYMSNNSIADISPLSNLTNLRYLELRRNPIDDWSPIEHIDWSEPTRRIEIEEEVSHLVDVPEGSKTPIFLATGGSRSYVITDEGLLWSWGIQRAYRGRGNISFSNSKPTAIMENVVLVSAGNGHTMAITSDGSLWAWGNNCYGKLGDESGEPWQQYPSFVMENVVYVSAGRVHTMAITDDGVLWGWGRNRSGQLGIGTGGYWEDEASYSDVPVQIMENVKSVSAASTYTMALTHDGELWGWGSNRRAGLGIGTYDWDDERLLEGIRTTPILIMEDVVSVSSSHNHTVAITSDGILWAWGCNHGGRFAADGRSLLPTPVQLMENVEIASVRGAGTFAVDSSGTLWAWGSNSSGAVGDGTMEERLVPVAILDNLVAVSGSTHVLALDSGGVLWVWGSNSNNQLGDGSTVDNRNYPVPLEITN